MGEPLAVKVTIMSDDNESATARTEVHSQKHPTDVWFKRYSGVYEAYNEAETLGFVSIQRSPEGYIEKVHRNLKETASIDPAKLTRFGFDKIRTRRPS
jgi:hypothetical protein